jgi:hypothetical protein
MIEKICAFCPATEQSVVELWDWDEEPDDPPQPAVRARRRTASSAERHARRRWTLRSLNVAPRRTSWTMDKGVPDRRHR